jgi:hypothetical protein
MCLHPLRIGQGVTRGENGGGIRQPPYALIRLCLRRQLTLVNALYWASAIDRVRCNDEPLKCLNEALCINTGDRCSYDALKF